MSRRRITAAAVLALVVAGSAACAQPTTGIPAPAAAGGSNTPGGGGDNAGGSTDDNKAFCTALEDSLSEVRSAITGESDAEQLRLAGDKIAELVALSPPEIASALQAAADGFHAGAEGAASDEVGRRIVAAFVRVAQELPRICS